MGARYQEFKYAPRWPMVVVVLLYILGVVAGWQFEIDSWWLLGGVALSALFCCLSGRRALLALGVVLCGVIVCEMWRMGGDEVVSRGEYRLEILGGGWAQVRAQRGDEGEWRGCNRMVKVVGDDLDVGSVVVASGRNWSFHKRQYIKLLGVSEVDSHRELWLSRVGDWGERTIARLGMSEASEGVGRAMLLGRRDRIGAQITQSYRESGSAHILAVSGLHVAMVAAMLSFVLRPINLLPRGDRVRHIVLVVLIWLYAGVVGMPASVQRAAIMFTVMLLMKALARYNTPIETLAVAVMVMVSLDTSVIFDLGFMLSVCAVAAIAIWFTPISNFVYRSSSRYMKIHSGSWQLLLTLINLLLIALVCSVAMMPLLAWSIGYISPLGFIISPVIVITAYLSIQLLLVWVALGWIFGDGVAEIYGRVVDWVIWCQNYCAEAAVGRVDITLSGWSTFVIYLSLLAITYLVSHFWARHFEE